MTFLATVYTYLPGKLNNLYSSIQYYFALTWLCCAHRKVAQWSFVGKLSKSGILWIYGAFKTTGNSEKTRSNHDVINLQLIALDREAGFTIPKWMTIQNVFSQSELVHSQLPSGLELTEVKFSQFRVKIVLSAAQIMLH
jgi:hypothetical protein